MRNLLLLIGWMLMSSMFIHATAQTVTGKVTDVRVLVDRELVEVGG